MNQATDSTPLWKAYRDDIVLSFRKQKEMAEKALVQVSDEVFFRKPGEFSNSAAAIVKHVAGNLASRWTDFFTTDGEKPSTHRRAASLLSGPADTRPRLMAAWEKAWGTVVQSALRVSASRTWRSRSQFGASRTPSCRQSTAR